MAELHLRKSLPCIVAGEVTEVMEGEIPMFIEDTVVWGWSYVCGGHIPPHIMGWGGINFHYSGV